MSKHYSMLADSKFYCSKCGRLGFPILRKKSKAKKSGHLKKLYCLTCGEETNHIEIRPAGDYDYEDFQKEFELGRFKDGDRVPLNECYKCSKEDCKYNQNGVCWNANNSAKCSYKPKEEIK